ncbi:MAG TPA: hypothetical protein VMQ81_06915 [Acidimicrobiia bacterium]|nr:hypothetical protein [Acidimicrobiia bacterium]
MRRFLTLCVCALVLAGCKVETTVAIDVREDGSGTVTVRVALDADAVSEGEAGGATLENRVRLGDLEVAGWDSSGWRRHEDGSARLRIAKEFADASDLAGVIAELNGEHGPLRKVSLTRDEGAIFDRYRLKGVADLSALATGVITDPELVASLTAQQVDLTALDQRLLDQIRDSFRLRIEVGLPGASRTFTPEPGGKVEINTSSSRFDPGRSVLIAGAVLFGTLALFVYLRGRQLDRRRRRRRRAPSRFDARSE